LLLQYRKEAYVGPRVLCVICVFVIFVKFIQLVSCSCCHSILYIRSLDAKCSVKRACTYLCFMKNIKEIYRKPYTFSYIGTNEAWKWNGNELTGTKHDGRAHKFCIKDEFWRTCCELLNGDKSLKGAPSSWNAKYMYFWAKLGCWI
jgi:hypothetical protein